MHYLELPFIQLRLIMIKWLIPEETDYKDSWHKAVNNLYTCMVSYFPTHPTTRIPLATNPCHFLTEGQHVLMDGSHSMTGEGPYFCAQNSIRGRSIRYWGQRPDGARVGGARSEDRVRLRAEVRAWPVMEKNGGKGAFEKKGKKYVIYSVVMFMPVQISMRPTIYLIWECT